MSDTDSPTIDAPVDELSLLEGIPAEKRASVLRCLNARVARFEKGDILAGRAPHRGRGAHRALRCRGQPVDPRQLPRRRRRRQRAGAAVLRGEQPGHRGHRPVRHHRLQHLAGNRRLPLLHQAHQPHQGQPRGLAHRHEHAAGEAPRHAREPVNPRESACLPARTFPGSRLAHVQHPLQPPRAGRLPLHRAQRAVARAQPHAARGHHPLTS